MLGVFSSLKGRVLGASSFIVLGHFPHLSNETGSYLKNFLNLKFCDCPFNLFCYFGEKSYFTFKILRFYLVQKINSGF